VANAIFDGTDAVMLSGETAAGKYPVESIQTMARIAERAEAALEHREIFLRQSAAQQKSVTESISQAVASSSLDLGAKAILTSTESGYTARMVSKYRPKAPIIAVTPNEQIMRRLCLIWGAIPVKGEPCNSTDELFDAVVDTAIKNHHVSLGDLVVITAGVPVGRSGSTNLIKVHHIGEMIAKGQGIGTQIASGRIVMARSAEEANAKVTEGSILVVLTTDKEYIPAIEKAAGIITVAGGITSHAAVVCVSMGKPVIVGVEGIFDVASDGMEVSIYPEVGVIYSGRSKVL
jgi:pyruvate kinase